MYEDYTRQTLPPRDYRELLGSAACVFNSNNAFVIENILGSEGGGEYSWCDLIDKESGWLLPVVEATITKEAGSSIADLFKLVVYKRNRILHSFQVTGQDGEQVLRTKERAGGEQFDITREYLLEFIADNQRLSDELYDYRGH